MMKLFKFMLVVIILVVLAALGVRYYRQHQEALRKQQQQQTEAPATPSTTTDTTVPAPQQSPTKTDGPNQATGPLRNTKIAEKIVNTYNQHNAQLEKEMK
ncbi:MAG: hypothetical protein PHQ27_00265 [Victivallales bacterium]|nr:hypothetical protein [Victivallales bacterium]